MGEFNKMRLTQIANGMRCQTQTLVYQLIII